MVALSVAHYLNVPLNGVRAPAHFFTRTGEYAGDRALNFEMTQLGASISDRDYKRQHEIVPAAIANGAYLLNLDGREIFADVLSNLGSIALMDAHDAKTAVYHYTRGLQLDRDDPHLWYNRGVANARLQQYADAIADYREALARDPGHYLSRCARAKLYTESGDAQLGLDDLREAINQYPRRARAYLLRGIYFTSVGRFAEAELDLRAAHEREPSNPAPLYNLGVSLQNLDRHDEALGAFAKFLRRAPTHPMAARVREVMRNLEAAGYSIPD